MDPITHSLVGGLVAQTVKTSRRRFWIMMFLGEAPDLDVFFGGLGPWAFWLHHRGITHSFFGVGVQAIFYALLFGIWDKGPFKQRLLHYACPLLLHACCDYLTSYGVPLLSPFDFTEFSGNLMTAITVIPLLFMSIGLMVLNRKKIEGWRATRWLWMAWGVTLLFAYSGKTQAQKIMEPFKGHVTVVSGLLNPIGWTAVVQGASCCDYQAHWVNSITGNTREGLKVKTDLDFFPIQASLQSPQVKRFQETIRWPVARALSQADGGWIVEWGKVIFSSRGMVRGLLSVQVSTTGALSDEKRIFTFWTPNENKS
ncbi:MAG: hypothetical protein KCHDKBKB_02055 [Elusimicrobia bacterium]|nr:hypothetical protein [Elusimicrobiota bacterium]